MKLEAFCRFLLISVVLSLLASAQLFASFNPPSNVPYDAASYAVRASLHNSTGIISLGAYASPASCPLKLNLFSQDVSYTVPILSLVGRAGLSLNLSMTYNSKVWITSGSTIYLDGDKGWPAPGWRLGLGRIDGVYAGGDGYNHYYFIESDGSVHDLRYNGTDGLYESVDSTYVDFNDSTGVLRRNDGTQITFALIGGTGGYVLPIQVKDRNGNYLTINYSGTGQNISSIVDTVGRTVSFSYNGDGTLATISKTGFGGAARTWTFSYSNITLSYSFASSLTVNGPTSGSSFKVLSSITFPNNTKTVFTYNGYAQLTEADLQSNNSTLRAKYLVGWQSAPGGGWTDSPTPSQVGTFDGTNTNYWTLAFNSYSTTATDPTSVPRTTTFLQTGGWDDGLPSQLQIGSPAVRTIANVWGNDGSQINQRITSVTTTLNDTGQQSQVQTDYTTYGNVQEVREYDFGLSTLLRKTHTSYVTDSNYTTRHILSLSATVIVYDGSGTAKSNTAYTYDGAALTSVTGAANHDDTNYGTGFVYRGLLTTLTQYTDPVAPSGAITHGETYDMLGNLRTEVADCCVQKQYNFSSTTQYSQPDSVVRGSGTTLTTSATYDSYTGLLASSTDENNQTTTYNFDVMDRPLSQTRPDNTVLSTSYDDTSASPSTTATTPITSSTSIKRITLFDGLGKTIRNTIQDSSGTIFTKVDTQYDALARISQVSLPYTGSSPSYWTQTQYDALDRVTKQIPADGSGSANNISFSYSGNTVTRTDNTGKQRKQSVDALGRLIESDEPDPANGNSLTLVTTYANDPLGHTTQITQGVQTRSFVFDGLGRKTSETTPEAGTVNYVYNNYSLMTQRTDARGVVTTNTYDPSLNRLSQISYNTTGTTAQATPSVSYSYGTSAASYNNGRLITMTDGVGSENYSYDLLGRKTQVQKVINNVSYTTSYTYNLDSEIAAMTYPSGRVVKRNYDTIGRLQSVQNNGTSAYYASGMTYNADNELTGMTLGNGVVESLGYTGQRYQLSSIGYTKSGTTLFSVSYGYTQNGGNNGQITGITDNVDSGRTVNYTFDALQRLSTAVTNGSANYPQWGLSWTYDRYGNRTAQTVTAGSGYSNSVSVDANTNRITGLGMASFSYDSSGNLTQDDLYNYLYDAENRLVELEQLNATPIAYYSFDGNGLRVIKVQVTGSQRTYYLYEGTNVIAEFYDTSTTNYNSGTTPQQAPADSVSLLLYQLSDHLTTRMTTDNFAANSSSEGHFPYGDPWYDTGMADPSVVRKFTSYNRDTEAAAGFLNYAVFRQHSSRLGRFQMADPVVSTTGSPQGFNRYAYAAGDPVNNVDPSGLLNVKLEIPADWPCPSTEVVCGCDPFNYTDGSGEDSPCTLGSEPVGIAFPVGGGGGGNPPDDCAGHLGNIQWPPDGVICDGSHQYFTKVQLLNYAGNLPPLTNRDRITVTPNTSANVIVKPRADIPSQLIFEGWFTASPTANHRLFNSAMIQWTATYTCKGKTYHTSTPQHIMPCLGTT
ncbi:MAG TPA: RHS repeat-associated core domain-containing protein [Candidatus Sulfotelmatobacter sp.]|nr:RHS repeat-associated core domain-containing protein [Candidatus Sulfotelmatobacter sp.]